MKVKNLLWQSRAGLFNLSPVLCLSVGLSLGLTIGCSSSDFNSGTSASKATVTTDSNANAEPTPIVVDDNDKSSPKTETEAKTLHLTCENADAIPSLEYHQNQQISLTVKGDLCVSNPTKTLTVAFIIDISGSMENNDPMRRNSCGRYKAIKTVVSKFSQDMGPYKSIDFLFTYFSYDANAGTTLQLSAETKDSLIAQLKMDEICARKGGTDYQAALISAGRQLESIKTDEKIAYFISDGEPSQATINGVVISTPRFQDLDPFGEVATSSGQAGEELRAKIPGLKIYSLFLGKHNEAALNIMAKISGDKALVREVANAADLADEISAISAVTYTSDNITLSYREGNTEVKGKNVNQVDGLWQWTSQPILMVPAADAGESLHHIDITIKDSSGGEIKKDITMKLVPI